MSVKFAIAVASFLVVVPSVGGAMDIIAAQNLAKETSIQVKACNGGACVSKVLKSTRSKMRGMPVLSKTSSALGKVVKALKKNCNGGCDDSAIAKIQAVAAVQSKKLAKSRNKQDQAFSAVFAPANYGKQLK